MNTNISNSPKPPARPPMPGAGAPKPAAKRKGNGAKVAKVVILSAAIASTLTGWGLISATAPEMKETASATTETAVVAQIAQVQATSTPAATATLAATAKSAATTTAATTSATSASAVTVKTTTTQVVARTQASR